MIIKYISYKQIKDGNFYKFVTSYLLKMISTKILALCFKNTISS